MHKGRGRAVPATTGIALVLPDLPADLPASRISVRIYARCGQVLGGPTPVVSDKPMTLSLSEIFFQSISILRPKRQLATSRVSAWAAILMFISSVSVAADSPIRSIDVTYDDGAYVVSAVMFAPVTQAVAWDVLTDFDHMAQWVPNVAESKVLKRDDTSVTIEQHGVAKYGAASFPYTTERKIELNPQDSIKTKQLRGSMRRVESTMTLVSDGKGTSLNYRLEIVPSLLTAAVLTKSFLEHEVGEQFTAIIAEMVRRAQ